MDYCFDNFQALNIAANETSIANENLEDTGVMNDNEPFVTLDEDAYIVIPKAAEFADAIFSLDEVRDDSGTLAQLKYTYADRTVGTAKIVTTGAKVEESYFEKQMPAQEEDLRVIEIHPAMILLIVLGLAVIGVLIYLGKKLYDNFYVIRHKREVRRAQKERFRIRESKKRYRRKDRMFK